MSNKVQMAIYKIIADKDKVVENIKSEKYRLQKSTYAEDDYDIEVYYKISKSTPKWKQFVKSIVEENEKIVGEKKNHSESFIALIEKTDTKNLYAIAGGYGFYAIMNFIDDNFGLDIISRLIKKDEKILKSVKEKSVSGAILGNSKYFRSGYNLYENDGFGKIYQELTSSLNKDILVDKFNFSQEDVKKEISCIAKSSFKLNKSIEFEQLLEIIENCEKIYNDSSLTPIIINGVEKINNKKDKELIQKLDEELLKQLFKKYKNDDDQDNQDFDICHKDYEKYLCASTYIIRKKNSSNNLFGTHKFSDLRNIDNFFEQFHQQNETMLEENSFNELIKTLTISSYNEEDEDNPTTEDFLINHIFGDISMDEKKYFYIDKNWYKIQDQFINDLNESCKSFINNHYNYKIDKPWNYSLEKENDFNAKFISNNPKIDKVIVLDKITPDNIEPCDILMWDEDNIYLCHVKAGFSNSMRELCSQIYVSANRIKVDINSEKKYIKKIYKKLKDNKNSSDTYFKKISKQIENITEDEFINIFTSKKLVFVLSVLDTANTYRDLKTKISSFNSNIAKFSLQELVVAMKGIDIELEFTQIRKS